jgi:hypothetical protein
MNSEIRAIQQNLSSIATIIYNNRATALYTDQELMTFTMGVLTAHILAGYIED